MHELLGYIMIFIVVGVMLGVGAYILGATGKAIQTSSGLNGTYAENATNETMLGMYTMSSWLPILAIVIVAAVVLGILVGALYFGMQKGESGV